MVDQNPDAIRGTRPVLTRASRVGIVVGVLGLAVFALLSARRQDWTYLTVMGIGLAAVILKLVRPPNVVTREGVSRPWRRVAFLPWDSIDHVVQPGLLEDVQVMTTGGRQLTLSGIDASLSDEVAVLGAKPVRPQQVPTPQPTTTVPTQREIEADVARRAAALAAERQRMSESQKRRPGL